MSLKPVWYVTGFGALGFAGYLVWKYRRDSAVLAQAATDAETAGTLNYAPPTDYITQPGGGARGGVGGGVPGPYTVPNAPPAPAVPVPLAEPGPLRRVDNGQVWNGVDPVMTWR